MNIAYRVRKEQVQTLQEQKDFNTFISLTDPPDYEKPLSLLPACVSGRLCFTASGASCDPCRSSDRSGPGFNDME
jgi:hypothetical protein